VSEMMIAIDNVFLKYMKLHQRVLLSDPQE
jgi:hypothetical protein